MTISRQKDSKVLNHIGMQLSNKFPHTKYFISDFKKADGNVISKKRYVIPLENPQFDDSFYPITDPKLSIELDIFEPPFAPLIMAEVEFSCTEMANAFIPPEWFDEDVTNNTEYHNSTMSQKKFD